MRFSPSFLVVVLFLAACGEESGSRDRTAETLPSGPLTDEQVTRWIACEKEILDTVGVLPKDRVASDEKIEARDRLLEKHRVGRLEYWNVRSRIDLSRILLMSKQPIPESNREDCAVVKRHLEAIRAIVAKRVSLGGGSPMDRR